MLYHVLDDARFADVLCELARSLKPGGLLAVHDIFTPIVFRSTTGATFAGGRWRNMKRQPRRRVSKSCTSGRPFCSWCRIRTYTAVREERWIFCGVTLTYSTVAHLPALLAGHRQLVDCWFAASGRRPLDGIHDLQEGWVECPFVRSRKTIGIFATNSSVWCCGGLARPGAGRVAAVRTLGWFLAGFGKDNNIQHGLRILRRSACALSELRVCAGVFITGGGGHHRRLGGYRPGYEDLVGESPV